MLKADLLLTAVGCSSNSPIHFPERVLPLGHTEVQIKTNQVSPHTYKMATIKKQKITSVSKDIEKLEHLCTVGEIIFLKIFVANYFLFIYLS